ncbi:MAG: YigZ family protein [Bacillota bacterium]
MLERYKTVLAYGEAEQIIEKSRFIGYVKPVVCEEEALAFIEDIKLKHKGATHNVPAYVIGDNYEIQRYSEDGEPTGTAGLPILDMLKREEIKNVAIVVTRYFGGVKLGTGGLVRAYTSTAKLVLHTAKVVDKVLHELTHIKIDYTLLGKVQNEIMNSGFLIKDTIFEDVVHLYVYAPIHELETLTQMLVNLSSGKAVIEREGMAYLNEYQGEIIFA